MADLSATTCPYCGQQVGRGELEHIRQAEQDKLAEMTRSAEKELAEKTKEWEEEKRLLGQQVDEQVAERFKSVRSEIQGEYDEATKEIEGKLDRAERTARTLQRQLEDKSAATVGGIPEEQLVQMLRSDFPSDRIKRVSARSGADVSHEVYQDGDLCGVIVYESKNVQTWSNAFISKLRDDKHDAGADYAILVTTAFPAKTSDFTIIEGIPVVTPSLVTSLVAVVRRALIDVKKSTSLGDDSGRKYEGLMIFLMSPDFKNKMESMFVAVRKLEELQEKEQRAHDKTWKEQVKHHKAIRNSSDDVREEIESILSS